jgi:hypothetical protein
MCRGQIEPNLFFITSASPVVYGPVRIFESCHRFDNAPIPKQFLRFRPFSQILRVEIVSTGDQSKPSRLRPYPVFSRYGLSHSLVNGGSWLTRVLRSGCRAQHPPARLAIRINLKPLGPLPSPGRLGH